MGLVINTNMAALTANRFLARTTEEQAKSYQRIASGERILSAGDDAAGLSLSEHLQSQIQSLTQAGRNASQAIAFAKVAEGGLTEISTGLIRLRELGIQASSDTVGEVERAAMHQEAESVIQEINRIANSTTFNGVNLLNGSASSLSFQVGVKNTENDHIDFNVGEVDAQAGNLGIDGISLTDIGGARDSIETLDAAVDKLLTIRANLGSVQNRLQSTVRTNENITEGYAAARSNIADTDLALETSNLVKSNILQQAGIAVLSQANSSPSQALKLL
ncbi:MAG: flagellin [Bdellovibrionia bacterium]